MRQPPETNPPEADVQDPDHVTRKRHYRLITPLFGGGVEPGVHDPVTIIRGSSIRGQLRFWWRACKGGQYNGVLQEMKAAEDAIWGAASTAEHASSSSVDLIVSDLKEGNPFAYTNGGALVTNKRGREIRYYDPASPYGYVAFPLQSFQENTSRAPAVHENVGFTLKLRYPSTLKQDVEAALWAWETLGGIGGRTRRGFGALYCDKIGGVDQSAPDDVAAWRQRLQQGFQDHVAAGRWPEHVPHLVPLGAGYQPGGMLLRLLPGTGDSLRTWQVLISKLKGFRQRRNWSGGPRPGRSQWPEPDAIRRQIRYPNGQEMRSARHQRALSTNDEFPRASFGLPIVFQFKDGVDSQNLEPDGSSGPPYDPYKTVLRGQSSERLASPLILRPLPCGRDSAVGLALVLAGDRLPPGGLVLVPEDRHRNGKYPVQPGTRDVLSDFMNQLGGEAV